MDQRLHHLHRHAVAQGDVGQQALEPRVAVVGQVAGQPLGRHQVQRGAARAQGTIQHVVPDPHRILVLELLELLADRRALVATNSSHCVVGAADFAVMISTVCPLTSLCRSGTSLRSTRAATARLPTSVCTA